MPGGTSARGHWSLSLHEVKTATNHQLLMAGSCADLGSNLSILRTGGVPYPMK